MEKDETAFQQTYDSREKEVWLPILHLSGLFLLLLPPVIIWLLKRDEIEDVKTQGIDVINFQLSMWLVAVPAGMFAFLIITIPILVLLGIFSTFIILLNTIKVASGQPYHYPLTYQFLKP